MNEIFPLLEKIKFTRSFLETAGANHIPRLYGIFPEANVRLLLTVSRNQKRHLKTIGGKIFGPGHSLSKMINLIIEYYKDHKGFLRLDDLAAHSLRSDNKCHNILRSHRVKNYGYRHWLSSAINQFLEDYDTHYGE